MGVGTGVDVDVASDAPPGSGLGGSSALVTACVGALAALGDRALTRGVVETILFVWLFRPEQAWEEIHRGAQVRVPRFFRWILTYVTPLYLLVLFGVWAIQYSPTAFAMEGVPPDEVLWRWGARLLLLVSFGIICFAVRQACRSGVASGGHR
jgi:hypothetical protein